MGIPETLLSTAMAGVIFHLFAAQPLVIVGEDGDLTFVGNANIAILSELDTYRTSAVLKGFGPPIIILTLWIQYALVLVY